MHVLVKIDSFLTMSCKLLGGLEYDLSFVITMKSRNGDEAKLIETD